MPRNPMATHNLIAVSANNMETAINTEQTLDTTMLCALTDMLNLVPRRETNADEAIGKEEPDTIYDLGRTAGGKMTFDKAQPQHFAFIGAYALGSIASAAAGDGYEHTITPIDGDLDTARSNPSFSAGQRYGKDLAKRRFASFFIPSFQATFAKDDWVKLSGDIKGTGKVTSNITEESITAAPDATSLTLAANAVQGASAVARLNSVHQIRVELSSGVWTEVAYSAVSDATPAVITISAPDETGDDVTYKVLYVAEESGWMTFPSRVTETPLRVAQMNLVVGGKWSGSAFAGGREVNVDLNSIAWNFSNEGLEPEFIPGAGDVYAARALRDGRVQGLSLDREFREHIIQNYIDQNETFGCHILVEGAVFDDPHKYQVEVIFPLVGVLSAPLEVDGKRLAERGDLKVLEDDTYGSVILKVKNLQATYAA